MESSTPDLNENNVLQALRYNGVVQTNYPDHRSESSSNTIRCCHRVCRISQPLVPATCATPANQAIYTLDKSLRAPYMMQTAIGVDRQLPGRTQVSVNFVNTRGVHVLRTRNINAPLPDGVRPFASTDVANANGDIYQYEPAVCLSRCRS